MELYLDVLYLIDQLIYVLFCLMILLIGSN